jgi:subtilisin family serine protease
LVNVDEFRRIVFITLAEPSKENVLNTIRILEQRKDVRYVGPNYTGGRALFNSIPNDPRLSEQWAINKIDLPRAWSVTTGSANINVGVIDTGINGNHEDLRNRVNIQLSRDFSGANTNGLDDPNGHGTHVAGIIGAQGDNGIGISGVNWDVRLVSLRALETNFWGPLGRVPVATAVNHARTNNIPILNASLNIGTNDAENQVVRDAVAAYAGLFIQAAGNGWSNTNNNPRFAGFQNVIVVGSTDINDNRSNFSDWGSTSVHLFAPGSSILSTYRNSYASLDGTSMAAPYVAGVAALLTARYPSLSMAQHRTAILEGVDVLPQLVGLSITGGRLNAYEVLKQGGSSMPVFIMAIAGVGGTVTGGGLYNACDGSCAVSCADIVTLIATPDIGYSFIGWYENDIRINGSTPTYSFVAEDFRMLEARFN